MRDEPKIREYYPLVDVVAPGEDWEFAETTSGSGHVKRTRPRAGGGKLFVKAGPGDEDRLDKIHALLNVKFGQRSKIGNIDAPLQFVTAVEQLRLNTAGWVGGAFDGFEIEEVFGDPTRQTKLAVLSAMNLDGSLNLVELVAGLLPVAGLFYFKTGATSFYPGVSILLGQVMIDELLPEETVGPKGSAEHKIKDLARTVAGLVCQVPSELNNKKEELADPKQTAKFAKQLYQNLLNNQELMQHEVASNPDTEKLVKGNQKSEQRRKEDEARERQRQRDAKKAAEREEAAERRRQQNQRSPQRNEEKSSAERQNEREREREERVQSQGGEAPKAQSMTFSSFEMDELDESNRPSPWMEREAYEHNLHGRDKLVRKSVEEMLQNYWGHGANHRGTFGDMVIIQRSLTRNQPARMRGRANKAAEFGRTLRHPHRLTTDGRVFSNKRQGVQGTVLIDISGSMSLTTQDVEDIIELLPAATIATYSGLYVPENRQERNSSLPWHLADRNGRFGGALQIIARGNKQAVPREGINGWKKIPDYHGGGYVAGGNSIDGTALLWLEKQKGPRFWVSDGQVTGARRRYLEDGSFAYQGDFISQHLADQCGKICLRSKILRVDSMMDLQKMIEDRTIRYV